MPYNDAFRVLFEELKWHSASKLCMMMSFMKWFINYCILSGIVSDNVVVHSFLCIDAFSCSQIIRRWHTFLKKLLFNYVYVVVWSEMQMICIWSRWCHCHLIISGFIKIQICFTFLVLAYSGCPGKEAIKWMYSYVYITVFLPWTMNLLWKWIELKMRNFEVKSSSGIVIIASQECCSWPCYNI